MTTTSYQPTEKALEALKDHEGMTITNKSYISFEVESELNTGIIFYPGAKVSPESYAPLMRQLAEHGYHSFIAKMPQDFAYLSPNEADIIIDDHPDIKSWYIIGHSLGGVIAAQYAYEHDLHGLILLSAYPQDKHDMSDKDIRVLSILGSLDGLIDQEKIDSKKPFLPSDTIYITIDGGNHAQMGYYGKQKKDIDATITTDEQHIILLNEILKFIDPTL